MTKTVAIGGPGRDRLEAGARAGCRRRWAATGRRGGARPGQGGGQPPASVRRRGWSPLAGTGGGRYRGGGGAGRGVRDRSPVPAIEAGRIFVPASVGALLPRMHLVQRAQETGARIVVPTGALLGLDAVRAAAEGPVESITIESRKPPRGLEGAPYLVQHGIDVSGIDAPQLRVRGQCVRRGGRLPGQRQCRRGAGAGRDRSDAHACGDLGGPGSPATSTRSAWRRRRRGSP